MGEEDQLFHSHCRVDGEDQTIELHQWVADTDDPTAVYIGISGVHAQSMQSVVLDREEALALARAILMHFEEPW